jgi:hypothetical protein
MKGLEINLDVLQNNSASSVWGMLRTTHQATYLIIFSYSLSFPFESLQRLYITDASTFAGLNVLGSFNNEITDSRIVLEKQNGNAQLQNIYTHLTVNVTGTHNHQVPNILCRIPPFAGQLSTLRVINWGMQNRNTQITIL